jgi:hypothetical protein
MDPHVPAARVDLHRAGRLLDPYRPVTGHRPDGASGPANRQIPRPRFGGHGAVDRLDLDAAVPRARLHAARHLHGADVATPRTQAGPGNLPDLDPAVASLRLQTHRPGHLEIELDARGLHALWARLRPVRFDHPPVLLPPALDPNLLQERLRRWLIVRPRRFLCADPDLIHVPAGHPDLATARAQP